MTPSGRDRGRTWLEESAEELYEGAPCGYLTTDPDGCIMRVNRTFLDWTGHTRQDLVGRRRFAELLTRGGQIYHETHYAPLLRMQGAVRGIAMDIVRADGTLLPTLVNSVQIRDDEGDPLLTRTTLFDATDRKSYERELLAAREREREARERVEHLQGITATLTGAMEPQEIARAVIDAVALTLGAPHAAVGVAGDPRGGELRVLARHGASDACPLPPASEIPPGRRATSGKGPGILVPLVGASPDPVGVLCLRLERDRALTGGEQTFVEACAGQAAQALERARLHEETRDVAQALQQSMLAGGVPADARFVVAARYLPAVDGLEVGGDWHDAFLIAPDRLGLVVGDVVGRGLDAASAMGQLRSAVRALALTGGGPGATIEGLDRFAHRVDSATLATLVYCELDLTGGQLAYACAGHPPPALAVPGASPTFLWGGRSAPLGAHEGRREQAVAEVPPGSLLLLYTDGLVERRDTIIDTGLDRLLSELAERRDLSPERIADDLVGAMLHAGGHDDVCLLCLALTPAGR